VFELGRQAEQRCFVGNPAEFHAGGADIAGWPDMEAIASAEHVLIDDVLPYRFAVECA